MFLRSVFNRSPMSGGHPVLREAVMKTFYEFNPKPTPTCTASQTRFRGASYLRRTDPGLSSVN